MIAKVSVVIVPLMAGAYVLVALIIIVMNVTKLLGVFVLIFESAFGLREVVGVALGAAMLQVLKRGYFYKAQMGRPLLLVRLTISVILSNNASIILWVFLSIRLSFVVRQPSSFCFQACLYRRKHGETEIFTDNIRLIIQDGGSNQISTINLQNNAVDLIKYGFKHAANLGLATKRADVHLLVYYLTTTVKKALLTATLF
jgi:hypothetical protein